MEVDSLKSMSSNVSNPMNSTTSEKELREVAPSKRAAVKNGSGDKQKAAKVKQNMAEESRVIEEVLDSEYIGKVLADANRKIFGTGREFSFSIHEDTNRIIIKVLDSTTKEVIKEIPPEKTLNALAKMWELAGLIIDERL